MRDHDSIHRELDAARGRLDRDLAELRHVVADKVDVKKRVKHAAAQLVERGKLLMLELSARVRARVRSHPRSTLVVFAGAGALLAAWGARRRTR